MVPYQGERGANLTLYGAINVDSLLSYYQVFQKTDQFNMEEFVEQFADFARRTIRRVQTVVLVVDGHKVRDIEAIIVV